MLFQGKQVCGVVPHYVAGKRPPKHVRVNAGCPAARISQAQHRDKAIQPYPYVLGHKWTHRPRLLNGRYRHPKIADFHSLPHSPAQPLQHPHGPGADRAPQPLRTTAVWHALHFEHAAAQPHQVRLARLFLYFAAAFAQRKQLTDPHAGRERDQHKAGGLEIIQFYVQLAHRKQAVFEPGAVESIRGRNVIPYVASRPALKTTLPFANILYRFAGVEKVISKPVYVFERYPHQRAENLFGNDFRLAFERRRVVVASHLTGRLAFQRVGYQPILHHAPV